MSLMEISKSITQNLDYSERNQILPKNDTQKSGNSQKNDTQKSGNSPKRYPKIWEQPPKSTQNNGTSPYRDTCKLPPPPSPQFWGQPGELSLFVLCFPFAHMNNLLSVLKILQAEHIFVPFTILYITFRTDATNFIFDSFWLLFWKCVKQWEKNIWPFDWTSRDLILPTMVIPSDHQEICHVNWDTWNQMAEAMIWK